MPISTRQPEAIRGPAHTRVDPMRLGDASAVGVLPPSPGALLPTGDPRSVAPALTPSRALALDARRLLRTLADPVDRPADWATDAFWRDVARVRGHLRPVSTRSVLAGSYAREAFRQIDVPAPQADRTSAVRLAYALRWSDLRPPGERSGARAAVLTSPCGTSARSPRPRPRRHRWRSPSRGTGPAT